LSEDEELELLLRKLPEEQFKKLVEDLPQLQKDSIHAAANVYYEAIEREKSQEDFMSYVKSMWPAFIHGRHHERMARAFEKVAQGRLKRLIINMPPRHTKSEFASYLLPSWFLGKYPDKKIIQCSNTAELAVGFGRKVRNLVDGEVYKQVFPNVSLRHDSKAAGRWSTNHSGEYFAIGVGGTVTGKGADLLIIDDPHSEQEAAIAENNPEIYDKVYEWYTSGPRQRLQPGGSIVIVMCMTGDTPVLMANGKEKRLDQIRPGDTVATFEKGRLAKAKVNNWQSNGVDSIYKIQTKSGKMLRANERHPFLVMNEGMLEWTRLKYLRSGDELVSLKDATVRQKQKQNPAYVLRACQKSHTTGKTQMHRESQSDIMENGRVNNANAGNLFIAKGYASSVTGVNIRLQNKHLNKIGLDALSTGMGSLRRNMIRWLRSVKTDVMFAAMSLMPRTPAHIGMPSSALTMTMQQEPLEDFYAMTATSQLGMERHQIFLNELHRISDFTTDQIVSIEPDGQEEVFDVEIDRTENFIANGFVSHNTRWSKKDLTGQVIKAAAQRGGEDWEVIEFPALFDSGEPLWPEFWSKKELLALKEELPNTKWMAQYQQNPTSESSAIVKREWWMTWEKEKPPACEFTLMAWDTAFEKNNRADYSACTLWGVFYLPDVNGVEHANIILLNSFRDRMEFPELKKRAIKEFKEWEPDSVIIEKKASGSPLIYELRAMGIPVQEYTPVRGNDKISRLNSVSDLFASGRVWAPNTSWAEEVIDEVASFPAGEHDDYVDSVSLALMRFRRGGYVRTILDEEEERPYFRGRTEPYY
jgi:predicted phage terminase large subunit-like protein